MRAGLSSLGALKTLAHEVGHELLHRGADAPAERDVRELEAEAVAYVVCRHFGFGDGLACPNYIAGWGGNGRALLASLERVSHAAREIIVGMEEALSVQREVQSDGVLQ